MHFDLASLGTTIPILEQEQLAVLIPLSFVHLIRVYAGQ